MSVLAGRACGLARRCVRVCVRARVRVCARMDKTVDTSDADGVLARKRVHEGAGSRAAFKHGLPPAQAERRRVYTHDVVPVLGRGVAVKRKVMQR